MLKESFKSERVDTCLLAHTFPLAFLLLLPPPSSLFAVTCSHAQIIISLSLPLPFHASPFYSLHPYRQSSRRGRAAVGRVKAAIIAISSLSPGGAPSPFLPYIHALIHTHPPRTPPPSPLLHPHTTSTPSAPVTEFRSLCCKSVCGQFHCWLGAQWFGCFVRQNHFLKSQKKSKEIAAGDHTSIVFALEEAERFMFGRLKPRIDAKKSFKSERVDTCLLAHTFPLAFLLPPSSSFSADTCSHAHVVISLSPPPFPPLPFHASPFYSLHPYRPSSRRGRAAVGRVRAAIIAISYLSPGGAFPPSSPTSTHSSTHPPRTPPPSPLLHSHTTSTPSARITEFRSLCCKCVCGQFHCWLGAQWFGCFVRQNHFLNHRKSQKGLPQDTTLPLCLLWRRQSGSCLVG